ncbi:hypothetical protein NA78x_001716 [Anatilimnocola sp. NA78]|uniref:hypothetical protein n=1 Tax=Anatilimnocola sp. NA78 TaxID=3415683 RepID=UPI003CE49485
MNFRDLTLEQAQALHDEELARLSRYTALLGRMKELGYPETDELFVRTLAARDAAMSLRMFLHYRVIDLEKGRR